MKMTTTVTAKHGGGCGGDGCEARDPWPLHHVRHRGIFCRLCSSCVLKCHPGSFCTLCFSLLDAGAPAAAAAPAFVHCTKCSSVCHLACLPHPDLKSQFVCPNCKNPEGFSYFSNEDRTDGKRKMIDVESAKVLLAASRLAANSMSKAAAVARAEAERKVKEASTARKRAREMLEKALVVCKTENEKNAVSAAVAAVTPKVKSMVMEEPKRKHGKLGAGGAEQKRAQNREIEKWMRFHEPVTMPVSQVKGDKDRMKAEPKSRAPNSLGQGEKDKKGSLVSSQSGGDVKEEERSLGGSTDKGPRLPQSTQDALVSRTNPRSILTGLPSTTSHS